MIHISRHYLIQDEVCPSSKKWSLIFVLLFFPHCLSIHAIIQGIHPFRFQKKKQLWLKPQNRKISGKVGFYCLHFDCIKIVAYTKSRIKFCLMPAARNSGYSRVIQKSSVNNFSVKEIHCKQIKNEKKRWEG